MAKNDYVIGYKRPPKATQFKPGHSGNPKGRTTDLKNLATDLKEELEEKIVVTEGGKTLELTKQRALLKTLMAKALKGESRAANVLIRLALDLEQSESNKQDNHWFPEEDLAIIETLRKRLTSTNTERLEKGDEDADKD